MSESQNVNIITVPIPDPGADNKQIFLLQAPTDALGGGIRILYATAINGAATGAGTSFTYALHKYSSAGTPAVNGTIAAAIGATTAPWGAKVPKSFTLDADYTFLDAGEWLVLQYNEQTAGNPTLSSVTIGYVMGK